MASPVGAAVASHRETGMSSSSRARVKNQLSTPLTSAFKPRSEAPVETSLEIDEAGIRLLTDFFLQLKKWDKLQSTRTLSGVPESDKDIAA
jgi:hypothetical protein